MLKQRWDNATSTLKQPWNGVVQLWKVVVSALCNVDSMSDTDVASTLYNAENPTSDFVSFATLDQCYFNVDPPRSNNVDPTLKYWLGFSVHCSIFLIWMICKSFFEFAFGNLIKYFVLAIAFTWCYGEIL